MASVSPTVPLLTHDAGSHPEASADGDARTYWTRRTKWTLGIAIAVLTALAMLHYVEFQPPVVTDKLDNGLQLAKPEGHFFQSIPGFQFAEVDLISWSGKKQAILQLPATVKAANEVLTRFKIRNAEALFQTIPKDNIESLFKDFLSTFGSTAAHRQPRTTFDSPEEYSYRLGVFSQFVLLVLQNNEFAQLHAIHPDHARHGITAFADWTPDEFNSLFSEPSTSLVNSTASMDSPQFNLHEQAESTTLSSRQSLPCSHVLAHPARTQGRCGSCWAFSVAETIRYSAETQHGVDPGALSAEFLVDCFKHDCHGSHTYLGMEFIRDHGGIPTRDDYGPTLSAQDKEAHTCKVKPFYTKHPSACVSGHNMLTYTGKTVQECQDICSNTLGCKAIEYGVNHGGASSQFPAGICIPNDSADYAGCDGTYWNLDLYVADNSFYTKKPSMCVNGHNQAKLKDKTLKECEEICDTTPGCMAFEYGVDHGGPSTTYATGMCMPNDSADDTDCDGNFYNLDLYVKKDIQATAKLSAHFKAQGESASAEALCKYGALAIALFSSPTLHSYHSGVLDSTNCPTSGTSTNHAVSLVGLDATHGVWIMRNSWGSGWGVDPVTYKNYGGHALLRYGENTCNSAYWGAWSVGPVELVKGSSCPPTCRGSDCRGGTPSHGGKPMKNNHCTYRCSHTFSSGQRFCGVGPRFEKPGSVDCSGCA